ncbi:MAG: ABC transporter ATP-binding protein [Theionarchaea archaeon]|nr:ABC transporter ATP-binding protein [Theionarchaea archaeon]
MSPIEGPEFSEAGCVIRVDNLSKVYGDVRAVDGISFQIFGGEVFAFLGPNGAGKTTTVEMLEMIREPTGGNIRIFGEDLDATRKTVRERIGVLPQEFKSFDRLTVRETLLYYQKLYDGEVWDVDEIIGLLDLEEKSDTQYMHLSGGLRQRVGVGIALVNDPDIVFLDEPTTGLDPRARREVWGIIRLLKEKGKTVFLTTHYMEEAEQLADRVCIIHRGSIIARGSVGELISTYGGGRVMVISGCDRDCLVAMAESLGLDLKPVDSSSSIPVPDIDTAMRILSYLKETGLPYREVDIRGPTLEDVFLSLTGEALDDGVKSGGADA